LALKPLLHTGLHQNETNYFYKIDMSELCVKAQYSTCSERRWRLIGKNQMVPKVEALEKGGGSEGSAFIIPVLPKPILIQRVMPHPANPQLPLIA